MTEFMNVRTNKIITLAGNALALLAIYFLAVTFWRHMEQIPPFICNVPALLALATAVLFNVAIIGVAAYVWRILLRSGGFLVEFKRAYIIMGSSQIAKYLPGNVFQYVGRIALGNRKKIPSEAVILTMGIEAILMIVSAVVIVALGLFLHDGGFPREVAAALSANEHPIGTVVLVACLALVSILAIPRMRYWVRSRMVYLKPDSLLQSVVLYSLVFTGHGLMIAMVLNAVWIESSLPWHHFIWGATLAWVAGFIVPGAPGGVGIREAIFVGLYGHDLGSGLAVGLAAILRVLTVIGDIVAFIMAYWLGKREM